MSYCLEVDQRDHLSLLFREQVIDELVEVQLDCDPCDSHGESFLEHSIMACAYQFLAEVFEALHKTPDGYYEWPEEINLPELMVIAQKVWKKMSKNVLCCELPDDADPVEMMISAADNILPALQSELLLQGQLHVQMMSSSRWGYIQLLLSEVHGVDPLVQLPAASSDSDYQGNCGFSEL